MRIFQKRRNAHRPAPAGFTLVELLVVISIIALLISILLPSLAKAREQAKAVVCMTRIKGILTAMAVYAADNNDFIAGSPSSSGSMLYTPVPPLPNDPVFTPSPVQVWDWGGGMAREFNMKLSPKRFADRFNEIRTMKAFVCPSNKFKSAVFADAAIWDAGVGQMISYNTSRNFMWPGVKNTLKGFFTNAMMGGSGTDPRWNFGGVGGNWTLQPSGIVVPPTWAEQPNVRYVPRVDKVGTPAEKVFIADGSRFSGTGKNDVPDYDSRPYAGWGGAFSDVGPYTSFSRSWTRIAAIDYTPSMVNDPRQWSYRHGRKDPFLPLGSYKMNVGFFDNHVESMNDIESANPHMWLPRGYTLKGIQGEVFSDVIDKYFSDLSEEDEDVLTIR